MDAHFLTQLETLIVSESETVIRCLVAAEVAVEDGRFNIAKVMRAAAHTARVRAMALQRLRAGLTPEMGNMVQECDRFREQRDIIDALILEASAQHRDDVASQLQRAQQAGASLSDILHRSVDSLKQHRDVMESDVAQSLWGCRDCGYIVERDQPDFCPQCGALGGEFEWFGPFYMVTDERLGRRRIEEIISILQHNPDELAQAVEGVSEAALQRCPTPEEWCMKEIAGHMIDVTEVFLKRVDIILGAEAPQSIDFPMPPWKLLEGKGYPDTPVHALLESFRDVTTQALTTLQTVNPQDLLKQGWHRGKLGNLLDIGTWLANHNVAHLKQIAALREEFQA